MWEASVSRMAERMVAEAVGKVSNAKRTIRNLEAYARTVLRNEELSWLRKLSTIHKHEVLIEDYFESVPSPVPAIEVVVIKVFEREATARLLDLVNDLSERLLNEGEGDVLNSVVWADEPFERLLRHLPKDKRKLLRCALEKLREGLLEAAKYDKQTRADLVLLGLLPPEWA